jgi:hypothetical protein
MDTPANNNSYELICEITKYISYFIPASLLILGDAINYVNHYAGAFSVFIGAVVGYFNIYYNRLNSRHLQKTAVKEESE